MGRASIGTGTPAAGGYGGVSNTFRLFGHSEKYNFMKNLVYFIIAFVAFLISLFSVILYQSRNEYKSKYNFVITKVAINAKGYLTFYNNEKDYFFSNYLFREEDSISKGDSIFKDSCSKILYVYRKSESSEVYEVFLKKEPNGTYPIEWFCN